MGQITATVDRAYYLTSNHVHKEEYDGVMIYEARTSARTERP